MGVRLYKKPWLTDPVLIASWPGLGNVGVIAVDTLKGAVEAEEFGEIEPWDFLYPEKLLIEDGELIDLEFPSSKFYFKKTEKKDLIFFIGEEQPSEGRKAYQVANLVLDVALQFGCRRVYTSGAAVAPIHHTMIPKIWAVPNTKDLIDEVKSYENTILMSDIEGRWGQDTITGLNGLLLGVAKKRGLEAICVMGEIPIYLQAFPIPYLKAAKSVLEVLVASLGLEIEMEEFDDRVDRNESRIEELYMRFPLEVRDQLDKLKYITYTKPTEPGPITEEDKEKILENIDKFFKKEAKGD